MRGLSRYVMHQTVLVMLSVCVAFSFAVWLVQALRLIDLIVNRGLSLGIFLHLAILILPRFVVVVLPVAVFVAVLFVYNKLTAESEIVVMRAAGVGPMMLARAAILTGLLAMALLYALSLYFLPAANRAFKDMQFEIRNRFASVLIQDGVFNTISDHLMVYAQSRDDAGDLKSIIIEDDRDPTKPVLVFAERGAIANLPEGPRLLLVKGIRQERDPATGHISSLSFEKYTLELANFSEAAGVRYPEPGERYTGELIADMGPGVDPALRRAAIVELNLRLAGPLTALALAALPVACLLTGEFNRRGQSRRVLAAVLLALMIELLDVALKDIANRSLVAVPFIYLNLALPLLVSLWLLRRDGEARPRPRLGLQPAE